MPGVALQIAMVVLWSSGYIGTVLANDTGAMFGLLAWRFVIFAALLPFVHTARVPRQSLWRDGMVGGLAIFGYLCGISAAVELGVSVATVAMIAALQPVATAAITTLARTEHHGAFQWLGLMLGLCGVAMAVGLHPDPAPAAGYAAALGGVASLVAGSLIAKADPNPQPFAVSLFVRASSASVLFLCVAAWRGELFPPATTDTLEALGWWVVVSTAGGFGAYFLCLSKFCATQTANLTYLTVPVTAAWAWMVFGEPIGAHELFGFAACIVGVLLASPLAMRSAFLLPAPPARRTA